MKRSVRVGAVLAVFALVLGACGGDDGGDDASGSASAVATTSTTDASTTNASAGSTTVIATDFAFDEASITAKANQTLTISFQNNGAVTHNLTIDDLDVDQDASTNETKTLSPVTPEAGSYDYFCKYHPSSMKGQLIVS